MKHVPFIVFFALYELVTIVLAIVGAPIVCLFARWDRWPTTWTGGAPDNGPPAVRGDLPHWARWWETFDERLPGGMYEPTVVRVYQRFGRYVCSVYWLAGRNRMFTLGKALFGREPAGREWHRRDLGPIWIGWGWKRYRATPHAHWERGPFVEVPSFTVRRRR